EHVAEQHAEVARRQRGPVGRDALGCQPSSEQERQILGDGRTQPGCREHADDGEIGELVEELREGVLHPLMIERAAMLEAVTKGFKAAKNKLTGKAELTEANIDDALRDIRVALLEGDVEFNVAKRFLD